MSIESSSSNEPTQRTQAQSGSIASSLPITIPSAQWQAHKVSLLGSSNLNKGDSPLSFSSQGSEQAESSPIKTWTESPKPIQKFGRFVDPTVKDVEPDMAASVEKVSKIQKSTFGDRSAKVVADPSPPLIPPEIMSIIEHIDDDEMEQVKQEDELAAMPESGGDSDEDWSDIESDAKLSSWDRAGQVLRREEEREQRQKRRENPKR